MPLTLRFLGCGDAFGSGGRFQTCFLCDDGQRHFLIDCGASSLIAMRKFGVDFTSLDAVALTHLHGDHFAGLPFLLLASRFHKRTRPLVIAGPLGTAERLRQTQEALFPGSSAAPLGFELRFLDWSDGESQEILDSVAARPHRVRHPSGAEAFALSIEAGGRRLGYSGDTDWCDGLEHAAAGTDLFICQAYTWTRQARFHLSHRTLLERHAALRAARIVITHMDEEMLAARDHSPFEAAEDGLTLSV
jgi:ribonuclease BN (tRNA processing enzyme)